ncbi:MAG: hypothetical protein Q9220_000877 [cf. Caloplaca sp. 1 TL-2023]
MESDGQQYKLKVPRFSSFRLAAPVALVSASKLEAAIDGDKQTTSTKHHGDHKKRRRHASKQHHQNSESTQVQEKVPGETQHFVHWDESATPFSTDLKGDTRSLEYGSNHGVPLYPRPGLGSILGTKTGFGLRQFHHKSPDSAKDLLSRKTRPDLKKSNERRIIAKRGTQDSFDVSTNYVSLVPRDRHKYVSENHGHDLILFKNPDNKYRTSNNGDPDSTYDQNTPPGRDTDDSSSTSDDVLVQDPSANDQQSRAMLSRRVDDDPADWRGWLALAEFQGNSLGFHDTTGRLLRTKAERRSNAEVELSIYTKALKSVVDLEGRQCLYRRMMMRASGIWGKSQLSSKWQDILEEHPNSLELWKTYLDFQQSQFAGFTLENLRKRYIDCLKLLQKARGKSGLKQVQQSTIYHIQIYVLLRLTLVLIEGGFVETAMALWQAQLEFVFNKPSLTTNQERPTEAIEDRLLHDFERFWDSEVPRIGEPGAKGWSVYEESDVEDWESVKKAETRASSGSKIVKTWAEREHEAGASSNTPSHTTDESSDDPYGIAFFSDIIPALIERPAPVSDIEVILIAFLCFCRLPPYRHGLHPQCEDWYDDQFIRNDNLEHGSTSAELGLGKSSDSTINEPFLLPTDANFDMRDSFLARLFVYPFINYEISCDTLFPTAGIWFSAFGTRNQQSRPRFNDFVLQTLRLLVAKDVGGIELAEYLLAFELQVSPSTVRKSAKALLKTRPSSLRLYNAYALLEHQLGNTELASKVVDTAIQMTARLEEGAKHDVILLWRSRTWHHLEVGRFSQGLEQLSRFVGAQDERVGQSVEAANSTTHLRLRNAFSAGRDYMLSLGLSIQAVLYSEMLVLYEYLVNNQSLAAAEAAFRSNLSILNSSSTSSKSTEVLFRQSFARLLYTHATHKRAYAPSTIRSFLDESIAAFPHNTIFLSLYAWNESRFRVDDRLRGIMRDVVLAAAHGRHGKEGEYGSSPDHVTSHIFAVYTDLQRGLLGGSNHDAVRGSFERALSNNNDGEGGAAHSASLWKIYFLFERANGDAKRSRDVYYRAMRACPWAKEIYMLAFSHLGEEMSEMELRGIYEIMVEKELRMHVPLE